MAVQLIKIGNTANDGTGDDLREAFVKVNANFNELDLRDDEQTTVSNLGATGEGLYKEKVNYELRFKKIVGGAGLTLTATDNNITIANDKVYDLTQSTVTGGNDQYLYTNTGDAEAAASLIDFDPYGFKITQAGNAGMNNGGIDFIYMAIRAA